MNRSTFIIALIGLFTLQACSSARTGGGAGNSYADTVRVAALTDYTDYRATTERTHDLLHTELSVSFDMPQSYLFGKAFLTLTPYFYATDKLVLDAKGFDIHQVSLVKGREPESGGFDALNYTYDTLQIFIDLDREYKKGEEFTVFIDYTAKPDELDAGGSAAITSDKGLYFINGDGKDPNKPIQVWTQGETEASSCWFPTIDKPNENTTQKLTIKVDTAFVTLSNGELTSSVVNTDGTRDDTWEMKQPHAPYLFMMAIGKFAVVTEEWRGKEVSYYVEPEYAPYAKNIYSNTVEMLDFYSKEFGLDYPWNKYSQVTVRDYVSGAMENTTAVIFGEFVQRTDREMIDGNSEAVVAHELTHHWFGDYVTCESWSNLTLNESFASFGEYLWDEFKYGRDKADHMAYNEKSGYMWGASKHQRAIVDWTYGDKEDMFDSHSYNKGSLVLNMLRDLVGPEAFRAALKLYLEQNAYKPAEIHHLRLAFEETTGQDWNWFFDQWWLKPGHPKLTIEYDEHLDENDKVNAVSVTISQEKSHAGSPVYVLPMNIDIYTAQGKVETKEVVLDQPLQNFTFKVDGPPHLINVDASKKLLCEKDDRKTTDMFVYQYSNAPLWADRFESLEHCAAALEVDKAKDVVIKALDDKYYSMRKYALEKMNRDMIKEHMDKVITMSSSDESSKVRSSAIKALGKVIDSTAYANMVKGLNDSSYLVISTTLGRMLILEPDEALAAAKQFENEKSNSILHQIADIYSDTGGADKNDFFRVQIDKQTGYYRYMMLSSYLEFLARMDDELVRGGIAYVDELDVSDMPNWLRKYMRRSATKIKTRYENRRKQLEDGTGANNDLASVNERIESIDKLIGKFKRKKS